MSGTPRFSPQTAAVLAELIRRPSRWRYGYDLMRSLGMQAGTLYPILARLAAFGWLETAWDESTPVGRPRRQNYRLTPAGHAGAREMIARAARGTLKGAPG